MTLTSKIKCIITLLFTITVVMGLSISLSYAGTAKIYKTTDSSSQQFKSDWSKTVKSGNATMKYGFDTFLINEDFTEGIHKTKKCTVWVNDLSTYSKDSADANHKAYADTRHKTGQHYRNYSMNW